MKPWKKTKIFLIFFWLLPVCLIISFYILRGDQERAQWLTDNISAPVRNFLASVCDLFPFSVIEWLYLAIGIFVIIFLIRSVYLIIKRDNKLIRIVKRLCILALIPLYIWASFSWLWNIGYYGYSFEELSGLDTGEGITTEQLYATALIFLEGANGLADQVPRDENGHFNADIDTIFADSSDIYTQLEQEFPCLQHSVHTPKAMVFSYIMSLIDFTGFYSPMTGEANINIDAPAALMPSVIAHELAHQRLVHLEQEANFVGIAACLSSGNTVYMYSGYLKGLIYLMNALYKADRDLWRDLRSDYSEYILIDLQDNSDYWDSIPTFASEVTQTVYDGYLKNNGQELGVKSYGACVDLLAVYYGGI